MAAQAHRCTGDTAGGGGCCRGGATAAGAGAGAGTGAVGRGKGRGRDRGREADAASEHLSSGGRAVHDVLPGAPPPSERARGNVMGAPTALGLRRRRSEPRGRRLGAGSRGRPRCRLPACAAAAPGTPPTGGAAAREPGFGASGAANGAATGTATGTANGAATGAATGTAAGTASLAEGARGMVTSGSFGQLEQAPGRPVSRVAARPRVETLDVGRPAARWGAMNDPEVTMHDALPTPTHGLKAHTLAVEAAGAVLRLVAAVPASVRFLADQARRAACSAALNLAEGHGRAGRDRLHHWRIAYGSAKEAGSALEMLAAGGYVDLEAANRAAEQLDRVRALTWRLLHPRK